MVWQSYEHTMSAQNVRDIAKMLFKKSIVRDYGELFPLNTKKEDLAKSSQSNFETRNGVKVQSRSLKQNLR